MVALTLAHFLPQHLRSSAVQRCWYQSWDARHIQAGIAISSAEDEVCESVICQLSMQHTSFARSKYLADVWKSCPDQNASESHLLVVIIKVCVDN